MEAFNETEYLGSPDAHSYWDKLDKLKRARKIADSDIMTTFEKDEDVWALVQLIKGRKLI